jgi:hypothetical protein
MIASVRSLDINIRTTLVCGSETGGLQRSESIGGKESQPHETDRAVKYTISLIEGIRGEGIMYFIIGDYVAGMLIGALTALSVRAAVWPGLDMVIAMLLGMAVGIVIHLVLGLLLCAMYAHRPMRCMPTHSTLTPIASPIASIML